MHFSVGQRKESHYKLIFVNALREGGRGPMTGVGTFIPSAAFAFSGRYSKWVRAILWIPPWSC